MYVTWSALRLTEPSPACPWRPEGARFSQAGQAGSGRAEVPSFAGQWWSVLATWDDPAAAQVPPEVDGTAWHVVLEPAAYRGDAVLSGGATPFAGLPDKGKAVGAAAVITLAGFGPDPERGAEFFRRFVEIGRDVETAPGNRAALIQAAEDGAQPTFSAWSTLRDAVTWAYHRELHSATVRRQHEHRLVETSGFLRCAVLSSSGTLGDRPDPLEGLTGTVVAQQAAA